MRGMRATEEEGGAGAAEGGTIPGGEEEVTRDEVLLVPDMLGAYSKVLPADHTLMKASRGGVLSHRVTQPRYA